MEMYACQPRQLAALRWPLTSHISTASELQVLDHGPRWVSRWCTAHAALHPGQPGCNGRNLCAHCKCEVEWPSPAGIFSIALQGYALSESAWHHGQHDMTELERTSGLQQRGRCASRTVRFCASLADALPDLARHQQAGIVQQEHPGASAQATIRLSSVATCVRTTQLQFRRWWLLLRVHQ